MATTVQYCSWDDVSKRLSAAGARLKVDDNIEEAQQDILNEAAEEVNGYLALLYPIAGLAKSNRVKYYTRDIAVFLACTRRGNPAPGAISARYESTIEALKLLMRGSMTLPDVAQSKMNAPVLSNLRVQNFPVPEVKVVGGTSTGTPAGYTQFADNYDLIDYSI